MFVQLHAWYVSQLVSVPHKALVFASSHRHIPHADTPALEEKDLIEWDLEEVYVNQDWVDVALVDGDWADAVEVVADERLSGRAV